MVLVAGLAFFLNLSAGTLLQYARPRLGLLVSEIFFIAGPVVLAIRLFYLDRRAILPMRGWRWTDLPAAIVAAAGLNHLLTIAGAWQETVWPTPTQVRALFDGLFVYRGPLDFAALLVAFALVPAICEEILFRGFLQSGLARSLDRPASDRPTPKERGLTALIPAGNLAGLPALSLPCGFADGMPIAIQLVSRPFSENVLLTIGKAFQEKTDWHKRRPNTSGVNVS